jgi:hypothetical protein
LSLKNKDFLRLKKIFIFITTLGFPKKVFLSIATKKSFLGIGMTAEMEHKKVFAAVNNVISQFINGGITDFLGFDAGIFFNGFPDFIGFRFHAFQVVGGKGH